MSDAVENLPSISSEAVSTSCTISTSSNASSSSNFSSVVPIPLGLQTFIMPFPVVNSKGDLNEKKNLKIYPKQLFIKGKHSKYRLIRKSPLKGSPTKSLNHILRKRKKVKSKGISPRKLKFILPKVTKFSPRKLRQPRLLKSKPLAPLPSELCNSGYNEESSKSSKNINNPLELMNNEIPPGNENHLESANEKYSSPPEVSENLVARKDDTLPVDGGEEEDLEDAVHLQQQQDYLAAFLKASSTIAFQKSTDRRGNSSNCEQKLTKQQRRFNDRVFALSYVPDTNSHQDALILSYLMEVKEALSSKDKSKFDEFVAVLKEISSYSQVIQAYHKIIKILEGLPDLQDAFVMFLKPEEAIAVGKYPEYLMVNCMRSFAEELKEHSKRQPQNIQKVIRTLDSLTSQSNALDVEHIMNALTPVLKLQPWLLESLSKCIPTARPQCSLPDDFEEINLNGPASPNSYEHIILPDDDVKGSGDKCLCHCHNTNDSGRIYFLAHNFKSEHCLSCALRFIDGRVFLQCGRALRLAKVFYDDKNEGKEQPLPLRNKTKLENPMKREIKQHTLTPAKFPKVSHKTLENSPEAEKTAVKKNRKAKKS